MIGGLWAGYLLAVAGVAGPACDFILQLVKQGKIDL